MRGSCGDQRVLVGIFLTHISMLLMSIMTSDRVFYCASARCITPAAGLEDNQRLAERLMAFVSVMTGKAQECWIKLTRHDHCSAEPGAGQGPARAVWRHLGEKVSLSICTQCIRFDFVSKLEVFEMTARSTKIMNNAHLDPDTFGILWHEYPVFWRFLRMLFHCTNQITGALWLHSENQGFPPRHFLMAHKQLLRLHLEHVRAKDIQDLVLTRCRLTVTILFMQ